MSTVPAVAPAKKQVTVFVEPDRPDTQPDTFTMCPLGLQFYTHKPMEEFQLLELDVDVKAEDGTPSKVTCRGAVVRCQREPEPDRYRIWVKFVDLPEAARKSIQCTSKDGEHLCPYCENF